jgi:hypothetical protein
MNDSPKKPKELDAKARVIKKRKVFKFTYVVLFISLFPILWYSFLLTAIHQTVSLFILFLHIGYRKKEKSASKRKFNLSSIFLIVFHLILITASILIYFFAKENPQTGNYYF